MDISSISFTFTNFLTFQKPCASKKGSHLILSSKPCRNTFPDGRRSFPFGANGLFSGRFVIFREGKSLIKGFLRDHVGK